MRSWLDLDEYSEILARSRRIGRNIGQISIDSAKSVEIRQDFDQFGQNPTPVMNLKPPDLHPKLTRTDLVDSKLHTGWLCVVISPTRVIWVEFELGTNPTRVDPWTPLPLTLPLDFFPHKTFWM